MKKTNMLALQSIDGSILILREVVEYYKISEDLVSVTFADASKKYYTNYKVVQ